MTEDEKDAVAVLRGAIAAIEGDGLLPDTNNMDAVEIIARVLRRTGVGGSLRSL